MVASDRPDLLSELRQEFEEDNVELMVDRRHGGRRHRDAPPERLQRRRHDRRRHSIDLDLDTIGFAVLPDG